MSQKKETTINEFTDWQLTVDKIANKDKMTIVELGWGQGTYYLLENFKKVISIELSRYTYPYTQLENHTYIELTPNIKTFYKDDVLIDTRGETRPEFNKEIANYMAEIKKHKAEVIFVDFGFHFRGEVVQELINLNQHQYIIFHDTNFPYYGYDRLDYKNYSLKFIDKNGQGTIILSK
jgi:16S rRNA A1518/A1519 N6-dimethyltransferase RsmA/KsgA/DIM1 with predicted DNA glycosylase/AP lyase activity